MPTLKPFKPANQLYGGGRVLCRLLLLAGMAWCGREFSASAQSVLNVTNFGAVGDAVQFYANTVSNSAKVTTTSQFSSADIGKTIEIWGVGQQRIGINSYGVNVTNYIDALSIITNVVNGTNLYISCLPQATKTGTFATCGTDNTAAFNNCIAAATGTNVTIQIPAGTYLCIPTNRNYAGSGYLYGSILVSRGGLHFLGEGTNTVLLSKGAFVWSDVFPYGTNGIRGFLFECVAPIANDSPIVLENLTLDGGVPNGNLDVHGITVNTVDGLGWDEQHSAWLTCDRGNNTGTATHQCFTNVIVQHWRGEMFKSIDQNNNGNISIQSCTFRDGAATALNIYGSWDVAGSRFENLFQVAEYYQNYYTNTSYFRQNFVTNITGNGWAWNGGVWTAPPFLMQSNVFYFGGLGMNGIQTMPAANISILDNEIHCADYMSAINIGGAGAQGTMMNSNIVISGNSIYAPTKLTSVFGFGGDGVNGVHDLTICNNHVSVPQQIFFVTRAGPQQINVRFFNNAVDCPLATFVTGWPGTNNSPYVLVQTNTTYTGYPIYQTRVQTNLIAYSSGPKQRMDYVATGNLFVLDDSTPNQIPGGAYFEIDNRSNRWAAQNGGIGGDVIVLPSISPASPVAVANGQLVMFYWNGAGWSTNAPATVSGNGGGGTTNPPVVHTPPPGFHVVH
jgi:hypothetical protein